MILRQYFNKEQQKFHITINEELSSDDVKLMVSFEGSEGSIKQLEKKMKNEIKRKNKLYEN
jgi:hypothetical protein